MSSDKRTAADERRIRAGIPIIQNEAITSGNEASIDKDVRRAADIAGYAGKRASTILSPVSSIVSSAKGVKSLAPVRSRSERHYEDGRGATFEERWSSH